MRRVEIATNPTISQKQQNIHRYIDIIWEKKRKKWYIVSTAEDHKNGEENKKDDETCVSHASLPVIYAESNDPNTWR